MSNGWASPGNWTVSILRAEMMIVSAYGWVGEGGLVCVCVCVYMRLCVCVYMRLCLYLHAFVMCTVNKIKKIEDSTAQMCMCVWGGKVDDTSQRNKCSSSFLSQLFSTISSRQRCQNGSRGGRSALIVYWSCVCVCTYTCLMCLVR